MPGGDGMETVWWPDVVRMRPHVKNIDRELEDDGTPPAGRGLRMANAVRS